MYQVRLRLTSVKLMNEDYIFNLSDSEVIKIAELHCKHILRGLTTV